MELFKLICVEWNLLRGAVRSDEDIFHDAKDSGDIDRYHLINGFHISFKVNNVCSQRIDRISLISSHSQSELTYFNSY
jgi:hypothetical protein